MEYWSNETLEKMIFIISLLFFHHSIAPVLQYSMNQQVFLLANRTFEPKD